MNRSRRCEFSEHGEKIDADSIQIDRRAKALAEEKGISYKEALLQIYKDPSAAMMFSSTPDEIKAHRKKLQAKLDSLGDDAETHAIKTGCNFGTALIYLAKVLATEVSKGQEDDEKD